MTEIVTLTINPAVDVSTSVKALKPFIKMRCAAAHHDPGGGGINVARVLKRFGGAPIAIYPAGGATGQRLRDLVAREGVQSIVIPVDCETREDLTVFDESSAAQYRFVFPGQPLTEQDWQACLDALLRIALPPAFVIASGSLPPGVPDDFFARVAGAFKGRSKVIVDTAGPLLRQAMAHGVYLIKPNLHEFQELARTSAADDATLVAMGRGMIARGETELIALSMGEDGALLISRDLALRASAIPCTPQSVSGAGDSFLGAMIWSLMADRDLERALRYAVAGGSAALRSPGTELCRSDEVHRLVGEVVITAVAGDQPSLRAGP